MKFATLVLIAALLFPSSAFAEEGWFYRVSQVAAASAHAADLGATTYCLGSGRCRELNPWLARYENPAVFGAAKGGVATAGLIFTDKLHKTHPKWAIVLNFAVAGAYTAIAARNVALGR